MPRLPVGPLRGRVNVRRRFPRLLQHPLNQGKKLVVHHFFSDAPQDRLVRNLVKASLDVALDDPGKAAASHLLAPIHGMVCAPVGPKPVGAVMKFDLENGLQRHPYCLLDNLVPQTGDSKLAYFAIGLGYLHPS